jgi:ribosome-binding factor A
MSSEARARRLAERIREEMAELLRREVADPRLGMVTITDVVVDREFSVATVYVSPLDPSTGSGQAQRIEEILTAFRRARGFLRHELAARIPLRSFPQLRFRHDPSAERGAHIEELIASLHRSATPPKIPRKTPKSPKSTKSTKGTKGKEGQRRGG